jgi:hypothetical protein
MRTGHAAGCRASRLLILCSLVVIWLCTNAGFGAVVQGTLCTSLGDSISSDQLRDWINELIPGGNERLLVMTQCFGGNAASSFSMQPMTSVISATSPGETAKYGGYDNDAANALGPGPMKTGANVHAAGNAGKHASETPMTTGAPGGFSLEPVATMGDMIESRHVLVYAGQPGGGGGTTDVMQRDKIKMNFMGDAMVTTVGGAGGGGWDKPGSAKGLREALKDIGTAIMMSPNPTKEQFIMYITDHGDLHKKESTATPLPQNTPSVPLVPNFPTFSSSLELDPQILIDDSLNNPGFSVFLEPTDPMSYSEFPVFSNGAFTLLLDNPSPSGADYSIDSFFDVFTELDNSGIVGDHPGEGIRISFQLPHLDSSMPFLDSFFDVFYDVSLSNNTSLGFNVVEFSQDSGNIMKPVPEPSAMMLAAAAFAGVGLMRRRRK